jgi:hypothetical protein
VLDPVVRELLCRVHIHLAAAFIHLALDVFDEMLERLVNPHAHVCLPALLRAAARPPYLSEPPFVSHPAFVHHRARRFHGLGSDLHTHTTTTHQGGQSRPFGVLILNPET